MSLNKVLNRPMFRKMALKKGHIKPIYAQTGIMVGSPITPAPVPALRKPPTFMERMAVSGPARFLASGISIPAVGGYIAGETVAKGLGIEDPIGKTAAGIGGSVLATKALPGLASLPAATSLALMAGPAYLTYAGSKERERIAKMSPQERAAHSAKSRQFGMSYLDDDQFNQQFKPKLDDIIKSNEDIKADVKISKNAKPGSGRPGFSDSLTEQDNESDVVKGNVDINKVVKNNDPNQSPVTIGAEDTVAEKGFKEKPKTDTETKITDDKANANLVKSDSNELDKKTKGELKAADGTEINSEVIDLARKYRKELMAGQGSQAKTVFLANLASGLLSGKTTKGGIGGALEVFGKALGPAVNNYATVKLKEDEISNDFMGTALELAQDEIDAKNKAVEIVEPDVKNTGVIRIIEPNGKVVNLTGRELKNGTKQIAVLGKIDQYGNQVYQTYTGPGDFLPADFKNEQTSEILFDLEGKYRALSTTDKSLKILEDAYDKDKELGGLVGKLKITTERVTDALGSLTGISDKVDFGDQFDLLKEKNIKALMQGENMSREEAEKYVEKELGFINEKGQAITGDGKNFVKDKLNQFLGDDRTSDAQNLERLAVNETILVYALANALKSKDRLTQKDIQNAKELVKVFSIGRGTKTTIRSLRALRETLIDSIEGNERLYSLNGGDDRTLGVFRVNYGLATVETAQDDFAPDLFNLGQSDLLKQFGDIPN